MRWSIVVGLIVASVGGSHNSLAASFDCRTSSAATEQTICANASLSALDDEMANAYRAAMAVAGSFQDAIRNGQRAFIRRRDTCGTNINCIGQAYRQRLAELYSGGSGRAGVSPSFECKGTLSSVEQTICASSSLSALDNEMAKAFRSAMDAGGSSQDVVRDAQRDFIRQRNACGPDAGCISRTYQARLSALSSRQVQQAGSGPTKFNPCPPGFRTRSAGLPGCVPEKGACECPSGAYTYCQGAANICWVAPADVGNIQRGDCRCMTAEQIAEYDRQRLAIPNAEKRRKEEAEEARKKFAHSPSPDEEREIAAQVTKIRQCVDIGGNPRNDAEVREELSKIKACEGYDPDRSLQKLATGYLENHRGPAAQTLYKKIIEEFDYGPKDYMRFYNPPTWRRPGLMGKRLAIVRNFAYPGIIKALVLEGNYTEALEYAEKSKSKHLQAVMERRWSSKDSRGYFPAMTIAQIQKLAKESGSTILLYQLLNPDAGISEEVRVAAWVIRPDDQVHFHSLRIEPHQDSGQGKDRNSLDHAVSEFTRTLTRGVVDEVLAPTEYRAISGASERRKIALRTLHQALIENLEHHLPKNADANVIIVPDGSLYLVPFGALVDAGGVSVIERHAISVVPSIGILSLLRSVKSGDPAQTWLKSSLVVGDPAMPLFPENTISAKLQQLPGAKKEAMAIAALLQRKALIGAAASEEEVIKEMATARAMHFATHGLLVQSSIMMNEMGSGSLSADLPPGAIVLSKGAGGKYPKSDLPLNGFLASGKVLGLHLDAELIALSACDTARGRTQLAEFVGLPSAFLATGARSVAMTLWSIPDAPTADLMLFFYKELVAGRSKAVALRHAMVAAKERYPDPADWGAFVLIGSPD